MKNYYIQTRWGGSIENPQKADLIKAINELDVKDGEHPDTWLVNQDKGFCIILHEKGIVIFTDCDDSFEKHLVTNDRKVMLYVWQLLINGDIDKLNSFDWREGNGIPPQTKEEREEIEKAVLMDKINWYNQLQIDPKRFCSHMGCANNTTRFGLLCKDHAFEEQYKMKVPKL
jgi:hypothetical protein